MCHVLIIEDEWLIADHLDYLVRDAGATSTTTAATEGDAVRAATLKRPDIILSDMNLLAGTGPEAVRAILSGLGQMPVIFITGTPGDCRPCQPPGVILCKPVDPARLIATFRQLVAG